MLTRSNRPEVRNPVLALPAVERLRSLPPESREALRAVLLDLRREAFDKKEAAKGRHKMWTATYWHVVAVYALHIARALRQGASTC